MSWRAIIALCVVALAPACAARQFPPASTPIEHATIVLLPDPASGTVGAATVSNAGATVELTTARDATAASAGSPPAAPKVMTESDVQALFGSVLAGQPPPALHVVVHFQFESDELTDESRGLLEKVLREVAARPFPEVTVVGHTDTSGDAVSNFKLGLGRAMRVRSLLVAAGLDAALIDVISHGEAELLVSTPDGTMEPRNRRVEITVR